MAAYKDYSYKRERRYSRVSKLVSIFKAIFLTFTIGCALLLILSYLATSVNPNTFVGFSLLGLVAPVLYIINIVLMLYWTVRWRAYVFIPLVALLMGLSYVPLYFRPTIGKNYQEERSKGAFTLVSYNVMGFINENSAGNKVSSMDKTLSFILKQKPDILCIQEFQATDKAPLARIDERLTGYAYKRVNYRTKWNNGGWGLAIYSKYPIIRSNGTHFENSTNSSLWADIVVNRDTIRVFNNHLQTTSISASDQEFIMGDNNQAKSQGDKKERIMNILRKLARNYRIRAKQADILAPQIEKSPYPVVVCGDFNDTPLSYTYKKVRGNLADAFVEKGRGLTTTYRGFFNLFRIDYVLHSRSLEVTRYHTPTSALSDHNPVVADIKIKDARR